MVDISARILDIDHVMVNVPDAEAAGTAFQALGFTVTPISRMPGLANRLICFGQTDALGGICNYIELMAMTDAEIAPPPLPELLSAPPGIVSTVLSVDDARAASDRLAADGYKPGRVLDIERDWHLSDGAVISPAFSVTIPPPGQTPFYWNLCQHKTAGHYVRPDFVTHSNTVARLGAVLAVHSDPIVAGQAQAAAWQAAVSGSDPVTVAAGAVELEIWTPAQFAEAFGVDDAAEGLRGLRLVSEDLDATANLMPGARRTDRGLIMDDGPVASMIIEIVPGAAAA